jgi:hypothetical protein
MCIHIDILYIYNYTRCGHHLWCDWGGSTQKSSPALRLKTKTLVSSNLRVSSHAFGNVLSAKSRKISGGKSRVSQIWGTTVEHVGFCGFALGQLGSISWDSSHRTLCTILSTAAAVVERAMAPVCSSHAMVWDVSRVELVIFVTSWADLPWSWLGKWPRLRHPHHVWITSCSWLNYVKDPMPVLMSDPCPLLLAPDREKMATAGSTIPWLAHKLTTTNLVSEENGRSMKSSRTSWHIEIGQHWCRFWGENGKVWPQNAFIHIHPHWQDKKSSKKGQQLDGRWPFPANPLLCFPLGQISSSVFQSLILSLDHPEN